MKRHIFAAAALALCCAPFLTAQPVDDTQLKQVILFGRHGVRAPSLPNSSLNNFSAQAYPVFSVSDDNLTDNGRQLESLFGSYYRLWLTKEGLLTGNDSADAAFVYIRANASALHIDTAKAFAAGLLPVANTRINALQGTDPLFDPIGAGVAQLNQAMAIAAVNGRLGGNPQALATAYAPELAFTRSILFGYPAAQTPAPGVPQGKIDVTTIPIAIGAGQPGLPVGLGGLTTVNGAIDPFLFEWADGMPASDVGWGQLNSAGIGQISRLLNVLLDLEFRTPYLARVQSSNLASHVERTLLQAATGSAATGTLGSPSTKVVVLIGTNTNITGLAGLLHLDWLLPSYQADVAVPNGILAFELRQSQKTGAYIVRVSYVAQTMDQLRNRTVLTLDAPPASAPVFVPGCSIRNATFDCPLANFVELTKQVIDPRSADQTDTDR